MIAPARIGGRLDWALLYGRRDQHRPNGETLQAEIRRLHRDGLKVLDIANALHLGVAAVLQALGEDAA